jgi:hypothetical protein
MSEIDWDELERKMEERRAYANAMIDRINNGDIAAVGLDEKDWIILRLLFLLYKEGRNANEPEARKIIGWFNDKFPGYGQEIMLAAFSRLAGEKRTRSENIYEPYWKEKGKWE